jgi:RHS repeat-associated protein
VWDATSGGNLLQNILIATTNGLANNRIATLNGITYTYDASGNLISDGMHSYQYDAEGRLASVDNGITAANTYDSANRRVKKVAGGIITHYIWEGSQVIAEYNGSTGALISEYIYAGSRMVAREQAGVIRYFHQDRLSTRLITDASGNVVGTMDHLPFGEDAGVVGESEKHRFTSYERDAESGTDYAINRQYAINTGRFMQPDPISGPIYNPQNLNLYTSSLNDPINSLDPEGLQAINVGNIDYMTVKGQLLDNPLLPDWSISWDITIPLWFFFWGPIRGGGMNSFTSMSQQENSKTQQHQKQPCREQDFIFQNSSGRYTASELSEIVQTALGEASNRYYPGEIEAIIATMVNRQNYNLAYIAAGEHSGPFGGGTSILGILKAGYVAFRPEVRSGEVKLTGAKALMGGVLYEGDYVCEQLKAAKDFAIKAANSTADWLIQNYPFTGFRGPGSKVPPGAFNVVKIGNTIFFMYRIR